MTAHDVGAEPTIARADRERFSAFEVARGQAPASLAIVNGRVVDVHMESIAEGGVAVAGERIAAVGEIEAMVADSTTVIDARGAFVTPGLIETHAHQYHSNLNPTEYARLCLSRGTTTVAEAFYGQGQIAGAEAVRFSLRELQATPVGVLFQVPVLAYLQNVELGLPSTPAAPTEPELLEMLDWDCVGLEEPPFIPFEEREPVIRRLAAEARARGQVIMGHGAGLDGKQLAAYAAMGITADHECLSATEAVERIRVGMAVSMRDCAISHDQVAVQAAVTEHGANPSLFMFATDVPDAVTMACTGHLDHQIRLAVEGGISPTAALRMATINAARWFRVEDSIGSLSPGRLANILVVADLADFQVLDVIARGRPALDGEGRALPLPAPAYPQAYRSSIRLRRPIRAGDLRLAAPAGAGAAEVRAIAGAELLSLEHRAMLPCVDGAIPSDPTQDVLKVAMVDRFGRSAEPAIGFIHGYGLKRGAIGTTYNPYTNNPMALGTNDDEIAHAINCVAEMDGGFVAVAGGDVLAAVRLPLCGLMSERPAEQLVAELEDLQRVVTALGCPIERPFHQLAFTAVGGELPRLKLSAQGMFDVQERELVSPLVG